MSEQNRDKSVGMRMGGVIEVVVCDDLQKVLLIQLRILAKILVDKIESVLVIGLGETSAEHFGVMD